MARDEDHVIAAELATAAGEVLLDLRARAEAEHVAQWALKDAGDRSAHLYLMEQLAQRCPGDAVLSEEGRDHAARLGAERVWIVDPLDGTREFSEHGRTDWAVHVALVEGGEPTAGAVALPAQSITYATGGAGPLPAPGPVAARPRLLVSRTRPLLEAMVLAERLDGELIPMGSAGAKAMAVVSGEAEIYAHAGGQYEWDSCAPVAVAQAAGFVCTRLDGSPLRYNRADPWLPDVLICHPSLVDQVRAELAQMGW